MFGRRKNSIPSAQEALPGRAARLPVPEQHFVNAARLEPPFPDGMELGLFGLGCFWGAERKFWEAKGVYSTSVGYAGGSTPNPTYEEVCSGATGHTEVVRVVFDPRVIGYGAITTEILPEPAFYYAEDYHQQYLAKNPDGYCGLGGTGVSCPIGVATTA